MSFKKRIKRAVKKVTDLSGAATFFSPPLPPPPPTEQLFWRALIQIGMDALARGLCQILEERLHPENQAILGADGKPAAPEPAVDEHQLGRSEVVGEIARPKKN